MGEEAQGTPAPDTNELSVTGAEPTMAGDEITIGGASHTTLMPVVEQPRRRRRVAIIAAGLAMTLVAGIAIAAAAVWNGWGAKLPEQALPASALFFARVDLAPGLGQSLALKRLVDKFPTTSDADRGVVDELSQNLAQEAGLESLNFEADVKPWFGGRAGFAYWLRSPTGMKGCTLYALASKDEAKSTAALSKVRDKKGSEAFGFAFKDGYAVTAACDDRTGSQAAAATAVAEATTGSLAENAAYRAALGSLPSDQLAVVWANLGKLGEVFADQLGGGPDGAEVGVVVGGVSPTSIADSLKGDLIVGIAPTDAGIELRYRQRGGVAPARAADALKELAALPGGSVLGVSTDLRQAGGTLASTLLFGMGLGVGFGFALGSDIGEEGCVDAGDSSSPEDLEKCFGPGYDPNDPCFELDDKSTPEEIEKCIGSAPGYDPNDPCLKLDDKSTPEELEKCYGPGFNPNDPCLKLTENSPQDVGDACMGPELAQWSKGYEALARAAFTGAFSSLSGAVAARLVITAATEADATAIETMLGVQTGDELTVERSGTGLTATTKGFEAGGGTLTDSVRYRQALDGAPSNSVVAFFVDMEKLNSTFAKDDQARLKPVKAIGGGFGYEGADLVGLIRIIIE